MGMKLTIYSENEENIICLTNHTIKKYGKNLEEPDGKNEYLSGPILGIEFSGKVDVYDKSGEILELKKLAQWAKRTAHEKDVYRKAVIEFNDISGNEYDSVTLEKAFVVRYEQSFDGEKGEGEFYILLRSLDSIDDVFGQTWDNAAWSIDDVTVKAGDTANIQFASNPVDTEYTSAPTIVEMPEYQKKLEAMNIDELQNELEGTHHDFTSNLMLIQLQQNMIKNEIDKRNQNKILEFSTLTEDEIFFVTVLYGEAASTSETGWKAVANIVMNRVGKREWKKYDTPRKVLMYSNFDAYSNPNVPYKEAEDYFKNRDGSNENIEKFIQAVIPVYRKETEDITNGCQLYYSPEAQKKLYGKEPDWNFSQLEEIKIKGCENDDLKFYKYK